MTFMKYEQNTLSEPLQPYLTFHFDHSLLICNTQTLLHKHVLFERYTSLGKLQEEGEDENYCGYKPEQKIFY